VSPIIEGRVVRGMAHRLLPTVGAEVSASGVARWYGARRDGGLLDAWVVDERDVAAVPDVAALGMLARSAPSMLDDVEVAAALARVCLELASTVRGHDA
jgi:LPPG:FO 2-phospho-L-lactate transferase